MLLGKLRNILVGFIILSGLFGLAYLSKPDRGGLDQCEKIFGLDCLDCQGLEVSRLSRWSPFENIKFKLKIRQDRFEDFKVCLYSKGFKYWEEGGLQYGSLNIGWDGSERIQYSFKKFGGHVHIIAHEKNHDLIYMIVSQ